MPWETTSDRTCSSSQHWLSSLCTTDSTITDVRLMLHHPSQCLPSPSHNVWRELREHLTFLFSGDFYHHFISAEGEKKRENGAPFPPSHWLSRYTHPSQPPCLRSTNPSKSSRERERERERERDFSFMHNRFPTLPSVFDNETCPKKVQMVIYTSLHIYLSHRKCLQYPTCS